MQEALTIRKQMLGKEHPETAQSLNNLATLYLELRRYKEAESLYREALSIYRQKLGEEHLETITTKQNCALLAKLQQQGSGYPYCS
jgi:tetratricopeptide (TPR) repeat protein